jgi:CarD family transcriptional regulator
MAARLKASKKASGAQARASASGSKSAETSTKPAKVARDAIMAKQAVSAPRKAPGGINQAGVVKAPESEAENTAPKAKIAPAVPAPAEKGLQMEAMMKPSAPPAANRPPVAPRMTKAATPTKTTERDEQGGDQKTMKNSANRLGFKLNEFVVYPAHGVGQIVSLEEQEVAGFKLELFVINFTKDKMTLRVPTSKVTAVGMRKLSDADAARRSLEILTGRARIKRTMWSRRAQEYEAKINSGDINAIAEVVRDLYRSDAQPEQSYSERQLYEAALDRMMREIAAVQKLSDAEALKVIDAQLKKNQKRAAKPDAAEGDDPDIEEAA